MGFSIEQDEVDGVAGETVCELKRLQISCADLDAPQRVARLREALHVRLERVPAEERPRFLHAVRMRFPVLPTEPPPEPVSLPVAPPEPSADELANKLGESLQYADEETRERIRERLRDAGLLPTGYTRSSAVAVEQHRVLPDTAVQACNVIMRKWNVTSLDPTRAFKLMFLLHSFVRAIDAVIWKVWKHVAPQSHIRQTVDLNAHGIRYVSHDNHAPVGTREIKMAVENLQQMLTCLLIGFQRSPAAFARDHLTRFAPEQIEAQVGRAGFLEAREIKCWNAYVQAASHLTEDHTRFALYQALRAETEKMIQTAAQGRT